VFWDRNTQKWAAKFVANGKRTFVGYFENELEAARAYDKKKIEVVGC